MSNLFSKTIAILTVTIPAAILFVPLSAFAGQQVVRIAPRSADTIPGSFAYIMAHALPGDSVYFDFPDTEIYSNASISITKDIFIFGRNKSNNKRVSLFWEYLGNLKISQGKVYLSNLKLFCGYNNVKNDGGVVYISGKSTEVKMDTVTVAGGTFLHFGGGIYDSCATLILNACVIDGNEQGNTGGSFCCSYSGTGGGIYNYCGNVTITNSIISNNQAQVGGGIANIWGTLTIDNSTIENNHATVSGFQHSDASGGGIFNKGNLIISNSTISQNSGSCKVTWSLTGTIDAESFGGGVCNMLGICSIINSTICNNSCFASNGPNSGTNQANGGGVYNGNGSVHDPRSPICCLINTTFYGNTAKTDPAVTYDIGGGYFSDRKSFGVNNIFMGNAGGDGVVEIGRNNYVGEAITGDTSVAEYNWINKEIFGKDTVALANNGGPTKTIALFPKAMAISGGVRCGYVLFDTLFDTINYKKAVTNIKPVYFNGTDWVYVETKSAVAPGTSVKQITADQRGFIRPDTPSAGAYEFGYMPIAIKKSRPSPFNAIHMKVIGFHGTRITAEVPVADEYVICAFNLNGRLVTRVNVHSDAGIKTICLAKALPKGLYLITISNSHAQITRSIFVM